MPARTGWKPVLPFAGAAAPQVNRSGLDADIHRGCEACYALRFSHRVRVFARSRRKQRYLAKSQCPTRGTDGSRS